MSYSPQGLFSLLYREVDAAAAPRVSRYLDNLQRLGVLRIQFLEPISNHDADYEALEAELARDGASTKLPEGVTLRLKRGALLRTDFGAAFLIACLPPTAE